MSTDRDSSTEQIARLRDAHCKADRLILELERRGHIKPGITEAELSETVHALAEELFSLKRYWHKRVVRTGENTLYPYRANPPLRMIADDDILFVDLGPVFEEWEADIGRTFVLGTNQLKLRLMNDIVDAWHEGKRYFGQHAPELTGAALYEFTHDLATRMGWEYGGPHCGHLVGRFPHERLQGNSLKNYIHPGNDTVMATDDATGEQRQWVYEIHFVDRRRRIGGFFEQWLGVE